MRRLVLAALSLALLGACDDKPPPVADDAAPPPPPLDGEWRLTWSCLDKCHLPEPALVHSGLMTIEGNLVAWRDDDCVECAADHVTELRAPCVDMPAQTASIEQLAAYAVCAGSDDTISVTLSAVRTGGIGQASSWRAIGRRR